MRKIIIILSSVFFAGIATAAELSHTFSSPAFSGVGYSSHVLTLKQLEDQRRDKNAAAAEAIKAKAESEAANTPQARFQANLENRIYAQLAKQITDSLFGSDSGASCTSTRISYGTGTVCGLIEVAGQEISWDVVGTNIVINIKNPTNPSNNLTMTVPAGTFGF